MKKAINKIYNLVLKYKGCSLNDEECKLFQELQNDLDRLEQIDNANPSEALETIVNTDICNVYANTILDYCQLEYETVKQALIKAQEQDKILSILKNKKVDIKLVLWAGQNVEAYNVVVREKKLFPREELTQEAFNLIKEWLENGK